MRRSPTKLDLALVARKLGDLHARCFLTGGTSIPLYITADLVERSEEHTSELQSQR